MNCNIYERLSEEQQSNYVWMMETNYALVRCDEYGLLETDENGVEEMSLSWIHSVRPFIDAANLDADYYPEGSISSNSLYFEAIRNFHGGNFPDTEEYILLRQGVTRFLTLRREDSGLKKSYLFGSSFQLQRASSMLAPYTYRTIGVSIRHTAGAIWTLMENVEGSVSSYLEQSLNVLCEQCELHLDGKADWNTDGLLHFTYSSVIGALRSGLRKQLKGKLRARMEVLTVILEARILSEECISQDATGVRFLMPQSKGGEWLVNYEHYIVGHTLRRIHHLIGDERLQNVIKNIMTNMVSSRCGSGIAMKRLSRFTRDEPRVPDFGVTASMLRVLWYSIEHQVGGPAWLDYCESRIDDLLSFCLKAYREPDLYTITVNENNANILMLPPYTPPKRANKEIAGLICAIRSAILEEMLKRDGKLPKCLDAIPTSPQYRHIPMLVKRWKVDEYRKKERKWSISVPYSEMTQIIWGLLKAQANLI